MRYALNATTIPGVDQYLARRPRLVRIFTTGSPTGYRRRIEYPGLKGIWRSYFLLILYDDPQREIPHLCLSGNGLLRAWRRKCSGRNATSIGNKGRRDYTGRFVLLGLLTLCRCLRISSGGHDRREGLWKGYSREGTGYTFRLLSERAIRYENTSGHIRFYVTACINNANNRIFRND